MDITYLAQAIVNSIMIGLTYSLIASGFTLIFSVARIVNFAHGEIYMLGAIGSYYLIEKLGIPFFLGFLLCSFFLGILGLALEKILFRPIRPKEAGSAAEFPTVVVTLALSLILPAAVTVLTGTQEKAVSKFISGGVSVGGVSLSLERLLIIFISFSIFLGLFSFVRWHREGRALTAAAQDSEAASLQGVNLDHAARLSFGIGFALCGAAATLLAPLFYIQPTIGPHTLLKTFIVVILGGIGSISGALLGGLSLGFIESFGRALLPGNFPTIISFLIVIIVLVVRPTGFLGHE